MRGGGAVGGAARETAGIGSAGPLFTGGFLVRIRAVRPGRTSAAGLDRARPKEARKTKRSLRGVAYVGLAQTSASILGTAAWLILIFLLHPAAYGRLSWLFSVAMLSSSVFTFGLGIVITTFSTEERNEALAGTVVGVAWIFALAGGAATACLLALLAEAALDEALFSGTLVFSLSVFSIHFHLLLGKKRYEAYMWVWIGARVSALLLPPLLYRFLGSVPPMLLGLSASYLLFGIASLGELKHGFDLRMLRGKLAFSANAWLSGLCGVALNYLDKILIGMFFPLQTLAVYQFSHRVFLLLAVLPNTLFFYLLPEKSSGNDSRRAERVGVVLSFVLAAVAYLCAPWIASRVFPGYVEGIESIRLMGLAVIPMTVAKVKTSDLLSKRRADCVLAANLFAAGAGVLGVLFVFVNGFGLRGLAAAMAFVQVALACALFVFPRFLGGEPRSGRGAALAGLALVALVAAAFFRTTTPGVRVEEEGAVVRGALFAMDTVVNIRIRMDDEEKGRALLRDSFEEIGRIERLMSAEDEGAEIYALNANAGSWTPLSPETLALLRKAKEYGELTQGAFDVTVKPLVDFWMKEVKRRGRVPEKEELSRFLELARHEDLEIDEPNGRARLHRKGMGVTLGGIAKGYAIDRVCELLLERGVEGGLVEIGGEMRVFGSKTWRIGIADPRTEGKMIGAVSLRNAAVATSGDYRRYHLLGSERIHHIVDPRTGETAGGIISATVVFEDSLSADALSTAVFVLGIEHGLELLERLGAAGVLVDSEGKVSASSGWISRFGRMADE